MKAPSILIVEDDYSFALDLEIKLTELGYNLSGIASNISEALELLKSGPIDLILLDITLDEGENGLDLGMRIRELHIPIIIITAHKDEEIFSEAMEVYPVAFLVKPFDILTLRGAIENAILSIQQSKERFFIKYEGHLHRIDLANVLYLKSESNYTYIVTTKRKYILKKSLTKMLELISSNKIFQIHRAYAVHLCMISSINFKERTLCIRDEILPIGRKYKRQLHQRIKIL